MDSQIIKIEKKNYVTEVYEQIKHLIVTDVWKEGEKLPTEHQLASRFNVSRVVVREALQKLRTENLIVTKQGTGSFVSNPQNSMLISNSFKLNADHILTENEFMDLIDVRKSIEFRSIELAAERASDSDFLLVQRALEDMENYIDDLDLFTEADYNFHYSIVRASHNKMFCQILNSCRELIFYCLHEMNRLNSSRKWIVELHRNVYDCLVKGDAKSAIRVLKQNDEYNYVRLHALFNMEGNDLLEQ